VQFPSLFLTNLTSNLFCGIVISSKGGITMNQEMMTVSEVAKIFKVSRQTVLTWINKDILKATRPRREYRITQAEVERLMKGE